MKYRYLLIDNDNTLMDFHAAEAKSLTEVLLSVGLAATPDTIAAYSAINDALWKALERGEVTHDRLKVERFARLLIRLSRPDLSPEDLAARYARQLSTHADLMPGAEDFVRKMHALARIALVSNGVSAIQRGRLARCPFTDALDAIIISQEHGVSKPDPQLVEIALSALDCVDKREALLIGDSATADIAAANAAGIDSLFLGWQGQGCPQATYSVRSLAEAEALLRTL